MSLTVPDMPDDRPLYPIEAEAPIVQAMTERGDWINVTPTAIATTALTALREAGWRLLPPARPDTGRSAERGDGC